MPKQTNIATIVDIVEKSDSLIVIGFRESDSALFAHVEGDHHGVTMAVAGLMDRDPKFQGIVTSALMLLQNAGAENQKGKKSKRG